MAENLQHVSAPEQNEPTHLREQEGWARSLSVPAGVVPTCSSYFLANAITLHDFRGNATADGSNPAHGGRNFVEWETSPAAAAEKTVFTWIGGSLLRPVGPAYPQVSATLFIDGKKALQFPLGRPVDWAMEQGDITLRFEARRFQSLVEVNHRVFEPDGVSGFYRLEVPARLLRPRQPLTLRVEISPMPEGREAFFFVSPRADSLACDLAHLRDEVARLQRDVVQLKRSHEQFYMQRYPELFPRRIEGERRILHQDETLHFHPPCITVFGNGEAIVTMREGVDHLDINGRIIGVRSPDGYCWGQREVLIDLGGADHRCAPIFEAKNGEWLTTDYRAAYGYSAEKVWDTSAVTNDPTLWAASSNDRGRTWTFSEQPLTVPDARWAYAEVERQMIQLPTGRLLVPANYVELGPNGEEPTWKVYRIAIFASDDNGRTWQVLARLPRHDYTVGESTLLQTASGKIILFSRSSWGVSVERGGMLQCDSHDGGETWSEWRQTGMSGVDSPGHLLQLQDGRILCTHASRAYPCSIYVTVSHDEGATWDTANTRVVTDDIVNDDTCYPTSAQLADGTIITVWYANLFGKFFIPALYYRPEQL